jgi:hypothetical protein
VIKLGFSQLLTFKVYAVPAVIPIQYLILKHKLYVELAEKSPLKWQEFFLYIPPLPAFFLSAIPFVPLYLPSHIPFSSPVFQHFCHHINISKSFLMVASLGSRTFYHLETYWELLGLCKHTKTLKRQNEFLYNTGDCIKADDHIRHAEWIVFLPCII